MPLFPHSRLRRTRSHPWLRDLVAETTFQVTDLVWPIFIRDENQEALIPSMPDVKRYSLSELDQVIEIVSTYGIKALALFPYTPQEKRTPLGFLAYDEENLICKALAYLRKFAPFVGLMADVALDPYTDHGHDGIIFKDVVDNDKTLEALSKQALVLAKSGAHVVAPSDMMDGRVGIIRKTLDDNQFTDVSILSYSAKYNSCFYGPFRQAVGAPTLPEALKDKSTYQMDSRNVLEALRECNQDIKEGADMLIIKPGLPYLDVLKTVTQTCKLPTFV
ncbi:MAG TPA: porphobilinogen synthase, partial [Alphaproteobacteria bacterium]|nr:porphobilinogen synthase [Alphaproteobacteria bacterium]